MLPISAEAGVGVAPYLLVGGFTASLGMTAHQPGTQPDSGLTLYSYQAGHWLRCNSLEIDNPTWAVWAPRHGRLYVSHSAKRELSAVAIDMTAGPPSIEMAAEGHGAAPSVTPPSVTLVRTDRVDIAATNPVHIALDLAQRHVLAACFGGGEVVAVGLADDGRFSGVSDRWCAYANVAGATASDSEPHQVVWWPAQHCYAIPDRGLSAVHLVPFDGDTGKFGAGRTFSLRPGSGPRHLVVGRCGDLLYLGNELESTLSVLRIVGDTLAEVAVVSALPAGWNGRSVIGAVFCSPDLRRVFVTNRGAESIAAFDVYSDPERPVLTDWIPLRGAHARFAAYLPEPTGLVVAFKDSDRVEFLDDPFDPRGGAAPASLDYEQPAFVMALGAGAS